MFPYVKSLAVASAAASVFTLSFSGVVSAEGLTTTAVTVYFTRHAEKKTTTSVVGPASDTYELSYGDLDSFELTAKMAEEVSKGSNRDDVCGTSKCAEELSDLGLLRAQLLADWFDGQQITATINAVYSSHKVRTYQTVQEIAIRSGLTVVQLPLDGEELEPEGTTDSECPTVDAILATAAGDTIVVAGHSGTLYDIMGDGNDDCSGLGLDTSDNMLFPKDEDGKVRDFGDVWKVVVENGQASFEWRKNLQPTELVVDNAAHGPCVDLDGDGWGWDGQNSCRIEGVVAVAGECVDYDGDGWGWDGVQSCLITTGADE